MMQVITKNSNECGVIELLDYFNTLKTKENIPKEGDCVIVLDLGSSNTDIGCYKMINQNEIEPIH